MDSAGLHASLSTVRATLDDLQSEIEAGDRYADRIHTNAGAIDRRVAMHLRHAARRGELVRCARELRASISQQRAILRDLRAAVNQIRAELRSRRRG